MKQWKHKCELQLLVCEPNPLRPDRVTVGFVLRDLLSDPPRVEVRLAKSLRAIQCIYPEADIEAIQGTLFEMEPVLRNVTDFEKFMQYLPADFPGDFALLPANAVLTDSIEAEIVRFDNQYLAKLADSGTAEGAVKSENEVGRAYILRKMQEAFAQANVGNYMAENLPVEQHTFKGDPFALDFGYKKKDGSQRMLHAVSLVVGLDKAKVVGLTWPFIRDGIQRLKQQQCELFAITENEKYTQSELAQNARNWLLEVGIHVHPVSYVMNLAQQVRLDLEL